MTTSDMSYCKLQIYLHIYDTNIVKNYVEVDYEKKL